MRTFEQSPNSLLEFQTPPPRQVWLVVYMDPPRAADNAPAANRLLSRLLGLLRPGFQHVMAVSPIGERHWLVCNPGSSHFVVEQATSEDVLEPIQKGVANGRFHCQTVLANPPRSWQLRVLFSCANVIAHLIGARGGVLLTPYALYRQIAAMQPGRKTWTRNSL